MIPTHKLQVRPNLRPSGITASITGGRQYLSEATDLHSPLQRLVRPEQYKTYSLVPNEAFSQRHYQALVEHLQLSYKRLPSDSTLRRALMGVDFAQLAQAFVAWAKPYLDLNKSRWFAIDGKGLNGSTTALCEAYQQFVNMDWRMTGLATHR